MLMLKFWGVKKCLKQSFLPVPIMVAPSGNISIINKILPPPFREKLQAMYVSVFNLAWWNKVVMNCDIHIIS